MKNKKIAIVGSYFWKDIVSKLEKDCIKKLVESGIAEANIDIFPVPGSLEIPLIAKKLAKKGVYDAIIALGVIHKGKTYHFELIANECARGCMDVSREFEIPVIFEVLAVYDIKDAEERAAEGELNRGVEAANATLKMFEVLEKI
jgi:6,7-dimethyl-8-ribityllumazine synthase